MNEDLFTFQSKYEFQSFFKARLDRLIELFTSMSLLIGSEKFPKMSVAEIQ